MPIASDGGIFKYPQILPLDVSKDLSEYSKIFVCRRFNPFRIYCCLETCLSNYEIYGELPNGDKKLLFTSHQHFEWCNCCDNWIIDCCCCGYVCCDQIEFQMDYKRNDRNFYTQGDYAKKGCYCLVFKCCSCCVCCFCRKKLDLKENTNPDDFRARNPKGKTLGNLIAVQYAEIKLQLIIMKKEKKGQK